VCNYCKNFEWIASCVTFFEWIAGLCNFLRLCNFLVTKI
jgi:hypothetical protein